MSSFMDFSSPHTPHKSGNVMEYSPKDLPPASDPLSSTCQAGIQKTFIQPQLPQSNSSLFGPSALLMPVDASETEQDSQGPFRTLSLPERWDLEGYLQLVYSLATVSLSISSSGLNLWDIYSPCLIEAFYGTPGEAGYIFTENELAICFQKCAGIFATFNEWPEQTKASVFSRQVSGKEALAAILQLIKLAKGFGIEGESWWELRRNLWMAFIEPFHHQGWILTESDTFQKIFRKCLRVFYNVGIKQKPWTYAIIAGLSEWRKAKETQENVAMDRSLLALRRRSIIAGAWGTVTKTVHGTQNVVQGSLLKTPHPDHTFTTYTQHTLANDISAQMSPGSRLREYERRKPLLNLQQRLAPSPALTSPTYLRHTPASSRSQALTPSTAGCSPLSRTISNTSPHSALRHSSPANQSRSPPTPITPETRSNTVGSQEFSPIGDEFQSGFGDLVDTDALGFGEFMDLDPLGWPDGSRYPGLSLPNNGQPDEIELASLHSGKGIHRMDSNEVIDKAVEDTGKQLWEMTDEEFQAFCNNSQPMD